MTEKMFYIMRGLPGSGKSYTAKQLVGNGQIFSTDDYWYLNDTEEYQFDKTKLGQAHEWNHRRVDTAVVALIPIIVVDNTNTTLRELKSYAPMIDKALKRGYTVELVEPQTDWAFNVDECFKRNTHNVPLEALKAMADRYAEITLKDILHPLT